MFVKDGIDPEISPTNSVALLEHKSQAAYLAIYLRDNALVSSCIYYK